MDTNLSNDRKIRTTTVSEAVVQQILTDISTGELKPGDKLPPQRQLAEQLGVSNSSIREALQVLQAMHVVDVRHGIGAFIIDGDSLNSITKGATWAPPITPEQYVELLEARCIVEVGIARLAASHATDEQLEEMTDMLGGMTHGLRQEDADLYSASDLRFHELLAMASKNSFLLAAFEAQRLPYQSFFDTVPYSSAGLVRHHALLEALQKHDPAAAAEALRTLLTHTLRISVEKELISSEDHEYLLSLLREQ